MKKMRLTLLILLAFALLAGAVSVAMSQSVARIISEPAVVPLDKKGKVTFMGSGFKPGQELRLLFIAADGVTADIGYALKPEPVANERGAWATVWSYGRFVKKKLIKEGAYAVMVADSDYNILATTPLSFK